MLNAFVRTLGRVAGFRVDASPRVKAAPLRRIGAALALATATLSGAAQAQTDACTAINTAGVMDFSVNYTSEAAASPGGRSNGVAANTQGLRSTAYEGNASYPLPPTNGSQLWGTGVYTFNAGDVVTYRVTTNSTGPTNGGGFTASAGTANSPTAFTTPTPTNINTPRAYELTSTFTSATTAIFVSIRRSTTTNNVGSFTVDASCAPRAAPPTVTSVTPAAGPVAGGTVVKIAGTNLTGATSVTFDGVAATGVTVDSETQITATTPAGSPGLATVTVTTPGGTVSRTSAYTYAEAPTVTSIAPTSGPTGGGTSVTLRGTNFDGVTAVAFGATAATSFVLNSNTEITAVAPAGTGTVNIRVTTPGGISPPGSFNAFTYVPAPVVNALSPTAGPASGGNQVQITGQNFTAGATVRFGAADATGVDVRSNTLILANAPAGSGQVFVTVTTANGTSATGAGNRYTYVAPPSVSSIAPTGGSTGGGTPVTITGTGFVNGNTYTAAFGATAVAATYASATTLTATAPAGTGTVAVTVRNTTTDQDGTGSASYTYAAPIVTALSATAGPAGQPRAVTITGTNFTPTATVTINGVAATGVTYVSATQLTATLPARPAGTYDVLVTTGSVTSAANPPASSYTYIAAPTVTAVTPNSGSTAGGTAVTVSGSNLTGATAVTFGGNAATGVAVAGDGNSLTATTPAGSAGAVTVAVTTPGGTGNLSGGYTYVAAPTIGDQPENRTVAAGGDVSFSITASGAQSYQWQSAPAGSSTFVNLTNAAPYSGVTTSTLTITSVPASLNGRQYRAVVTNGAGTATSDAATLTVVQLATANNQSVSVAFNTATAITLTGTDPNNPPRTLTYTISSAPSSGTLSGLNPATGAVTYTPNANYVGADSFTFRVNNGFGASPTAGTVSITVAPPPAPAAPVVTTPANGRTINTAAPVVSGTTIAGTTVAVYLDGALSGAATVSGSSFSYTPSSALAQGSHTVYAVASNAGGPSPQSTTNTFTVDTVLPAPPVVTTPANGSTTSNRQPVVSGTAEANSTVTVIIDGSPVGATSVNAGGSWTLTAPTPLSYASHTVRAITTDAAGNDSPSSTTNTFTVVQVPAVSSVSPASGSVNGSTAVTISGSGFTGATAVTFGGTAATGVTVVSDTTITATTPQHAPGPVAVAVTNAAGTGTSAAGAYTYVAPTISISPPAGGLPSGTAGVAYSLTFTASGGTSPYTYATTGTLPAGMTFTSGGRLSGTPTQVGSFSFTVTATDSSGTGAGGPFAGSRAYTLTIQAPTIVVSPTTLPAMQVGVAYSTTVSASGGTAGYTYTVTAGDLPAGLTLNGATGTISGTPTQGGSVSFTITATDSTTGAAAPYTGSRTYAPNVQAAAITVAPGSLPAATRNAAYSQQLTASGGTAPYTFSLAGGTLPPGLTLASDGTLSGRATVEGSFTFTVRATDSSTGTGPYSGTQGYTMVVNAPTITIAPVSLPQASRTVAYSQQLSASGGAGTYTYAVTAGALPAGITLSGSGLLSGTPTVQGSFNFTVTASDTNNNPGSQAYTLTVAPPPITITPASLPDGTVETPYSATLSASGTTAPYSFSVTAGSLPSGLTLSPAGTIAGTPDAEGSYSFTVTATDSATPASSAEQGYTINIGAPAGGLTRTWVSGVGDDANACSRIAPCQTFAVAFARTATGGEINCLDAGGYGAVRITRSVSISCGDRVGRGGVLVSGGNGITVAAPADARVVLSGLDFEGVGNSAAPAGVNGVRFESGASLLIRNATFRGFRGHAIDVEPTTAAQLNLVGVRVVDSGQTGGTATGGVLIRPAGSVTVRATVSGSQVVGSRGDGIALETAAGTTGQVYAAIVDSVVTGNAGAGIASRGAGGAVQTSVSGTTVTGNGTGVVTEGTGSTTTIANSGISRNATGVSSTGGGATRSADGNTLAGNGTDGAFNGTVPRQ